MTPLKRKKKTFLPFFLSFFFSSHSLPLFTLLLLLLSNILQSTRSIISLF